MTTFRLKALKEPVYSQKEAEAAAGMGSYVLHAPVTMAAHKDTEMEEVEQSKTAWDDVLVILSCWLLCLVPDMFLVLEASCKAISPTAIEDLNIE